MERFFYFLLLFLTGVIGINANPRIIVNHVGYELQGPKRAVIEANAEDNFSSFAIKRVFDDSIVFSGTPAKAGAVDQWKKWYFWTIKFDGVSQEGDYYVECAIANGQIHSCPFRICKNILERQTLSNVLYYLKGQRCSGLLDMADRSVPFSDSLQKRIDAHGGWYDATGDYGKHFSHLMNSTYFSPQQIPFVVYSLLKSYERLKERGDPNFAQYLRRMLDEAMYGADFLVRMKDSAGSFYRSVQGIGPGKRPEDRRLMCDSLMPAPGEETGTKPHTSCEVGFRTGGGIAIASLAMASTYASSGDFSREEYLRTAEVAFHFLQEHNLLFLNDGKENILDDYCALCAATELYKATGKREYYVAAEGRAENLSARLVSSGDNQNYWRVDDGDRPFFHAVDAGLPVTSLLYFCEIAEGQVKEEVMKTIRKSLLYELHITNAVTNPFGYARQFVQNLKRQRRASFFIPHETETDGWWQGENARLASLATAAVIASRYFESDTVFATQLREYAANQLNWILGLNPFDACMLNGTGRNNPPYFFFESYEYTNAPGGICNGITSGFADEDDIDLNVPYVVTKGDNDWRWGEQWLPHAAWYILAVANGK